MNFDHLPYVAAAYALGVLVPLVFSVGAWTRTRRAERRLAALDPRAGRDPRGGRARGERGA